MYLGAGGVSYLVVGEWTAGGEVVLGTPLEERFGADSVMVEGELRLALVLPIDEIAVAMALSKLFDSDAVIVRPCDNTQFVNHFRTIMEKGWYERSTITS